MLTALCYFVALQDICQQVRQTSYANRAHSHDLDCNEEGPLIVSVQTQWPVSAGLDTQSKSLVGVPTVVPARTNADSYVLQQHLQGSQLRLWPQWLMQLYWWQSSPHSLPVWVTCRTVWLRCVTCSQAWASLVTLLAWPAFMSVLAFFRFQSG